MTRKAQLQKLLAELDEAKAKYDAYEIQPSEYITIAARIQRKMAELKVGR